MPVIVELLPRWMRGFASAEFEARIRTHLQEQINRTPEEQHTAAAKRMERIDELPKEIRLLVHELGWPPVRKAIQKCGFDRKAIKNEILGITVQRNDLKDLF